MIPDAAPASVRQIATRAVHRAMHGSAAHVRAGTCSHASVAAQDQPARFDAIDVFELPDPTSDSTGARIWVVIVERASRASVGRGQLEKQFGLTPREAEVALAMAERMSSPEIAMALGISPNTARRHCERVLAKLALRSRRAVRAVIYPCDQER
jgi:DNA-binding CsgD family transcriptional regulator